ncbi:hypothetical protein FLL45_04730 [Aliikangiella marina]|uniref:DUF885 domain-containing protein n=1 Tax=Aliikangiella marina TaxID=1712262 RepID=A0A545TJA9_9GAMM|nr:hypothetical protein [Aliikangiella marina]TQV77256.1 hypothetical protein FLL45_04730 [Aliikangiella marina]
MFARVTFSLLTILLFNLLVSSIQVRANEQYLALENLFRDWREFESPPLYNGAPDYRERTFRQRLSNFKALRKRLKAIDQSTLTIAQQVDWMILWAELNGYEFNQKILKPWARDPAFYKSVWTYKSDVPAHEGPTHHAVTELWTYQFPLGSSEQKRLTDDLKVIPALNEQAKTNLVGNAKELWIAGIRDIKTQHQVLLKLKKELNGQSSKPLSSAIDKAIQSTQEFATWLEAQAKNKTGPSGLGKAHYTWYLNNVHLVPLNWQDEVRLLQRELDRSWSSLKLEEHRNRNLAPLKSAESPEEYNALAEKSVQSFMNFLSQQDIVTVADYFEPALREHMGQFVPKKTRHFFYIASHYDPRPLYSHFYHWFELARMEKSPNKSQIRREPLLYNIFDSRNEGTATAVEEIFMHAGLYDDSPRVRELVWIMLAQRAARGLGSLYAHSNDMTMENAGKIHSDWTPRGWMKTEPDLLIFEQHLYLRQPGYGTSYITGKYLLEKTMAHYSKVKEEQGHPFVLKDFMDELNRVGSIPIALGHWQMTGDKTDINKILDNYQPLK